MQTIKEGTRINDKFSKQEYLRMFIKPVETVNKLIGRRFSEVTEMSFGIIGASIMLINSTSTIYTTTGRIQKYATLFVLLLLLKAVIGYLLGYFGFYIYTAFLAHFANKGEKSDLVNKIRTAFAWGIVPLVIFFVSLSITTNMSPDVYSWSMNISDIHLYLILIGIVAIPLSIRTIICSLKGAIDSTYSRVFAVIFEGTLGFIGILSILYLLWVSLSALLVLMSPIII